MKKSLSLFLILSLVLSTIIIPAQLRAEEEKEEVKNTMTCEWKENNRTLVLKGKGRLADSKWEDKVKTWYPTLKKLIISDGITSIGAGFIGHGQKRKTVCHVGSILSMRDVKACPPQ